MAGRNFPHIGYEIERAFKYCATIYPVFCLVNIQPSADRLANRFPYTVFLRGVVSDG